MSIAEELAQLVGYRAELPDGYGLLVEVTVLDAGLVYGVKRCLVTPVAGSGRRWVNLDRLKFATVEDVLGGE